MTSFISIQSKQISGSLFNATGVDRSITVARDKQAPVVMTGYLAAGEVKTAEGDYKPSAYGRLQLEAAKAGEGDKARLVLLAAGLRGVLFRAEGKDYDYSGRMEAGDGTEFPIFGRKVTGRSGVFISLSSMERVAAKEDQESVPAQVDQGLDSEIPF